MRARSGDIERSLPDDSERMSQHDVCHRPLRHAAPATVTAFTAVRVDDHVRVTLRNAGVVAFQGAAVQADATVAMDGRRFLYSDTIRVEKKHVSTAKNDDSLRGDRLLCSRRHGCGNQYCGW